MPKNGQKWGAGAVLGIQVHDGGSGSKGGVAFVMYCKDQQSGGASIGVNLDNTKSPSRFLKASGVGVLS